VDGASEDWVGTDLEFKIFRQLGKTMLYFRHLNWQKNAKSFPHCSIDWAIFLINLKDFAESGKGRPQAYDMPINMWNPPNLRALEQGLA
jgi:hypothetical protein